MQARVRTDTGDGGGSVACNQQISGGAQWRYTNTFYDGIGRALQTQTETDGGISVVNRAYDARGLLFRESVPHLASSTGAFLGTDWSSNTGPFTKPTYDELRRVRITNLPDGSTTEARYNGWDTDAWDQKRHRTGQSRDALGRLETVTEYVGTELGNQYAVTAYKYDAADHLRRVTDHAGNNTNVTYDQLGRKTQLQDPDAGTWNYEYNATGALTRQTDALGQRLDFFYDRLGRMTRKEGTPAGGSASVLARFYYDEASGGAPRAPHAHRRSFRLGQQRHPGHERSMDLWHRRPCDAARPDHLGQRLHHELPV